MRVLRASLAAFLMLLGVVPVAFGTTVSMSTPYPSVVADSGATAKFPIVVSTDTPQRVDLSVANAPQGWTTRLRGGGSTISAVTTVPASEASTNASPAPTSGNFGTFDLEIDVPADAQPGANQVVVQGKSADGTTTTLTLDVTIEATQAGDVTMTTDFPELTGSTSTNFRFNLTLRNETNQQITFGLETDAPAGWTVTATPAGETNAASAVVDAGATATITVVAKADAATPAGKYNFTVRAMGGPQPVEEQLTVNLTGTFAMSLTTSDQRLNMNVTAGTTSTINFVVSNDGSSDLTGVTLTATPPRDWKVTFSPATVDIAAGTGSTATVTASVTPANNALAGDYVMAVSAHNSDNTANDSVQIRATVETAPIGYLVGIAIIVLVGIGLFVVFQRYGRR